MLVSIRSELSNKYHTSKIAIIERREYAHKYVLLVIIIIMMHTHVIDFIANCFIKPRKQ
jgi:hypothetical protein